jgi:hypothetical protein
MAITFALPAFCVFSAYSEQKAVRSFAIDPIKQTFWLLAKRLAVGGAVKPHSSGPERESDKHVSNLEELKAAEIKM